MAETKKYVRIKKASVDGVWYADKIGYVYEVDRENCVSILTKRGIRGLSSVLREDAELIVTEKRPAKVGERVLITESAPIGKQAYEAGDVFEVAIADDPFTKDIRVLGMPDFIDYREYEVIVNNEVKNEEADGMEIDLNAMGYDELIAHGEEVMWTIRMRAYGEGYRQSKFDTEMDTTHGQAPIVSAQARRDEIVEQAKADVSGLFKRDIGYRHDFIVNSEKRTVVALRKSFVEGYVRDRGIAKAAPDDCFNVHIGKAIALRRALGLAVPDEYLNAPQPTEVRVGDVVRGNRGDDHYYSKNKTFTITSDSVERIADGFLYKENTDDWIEREQIGRIIDDSREEVGV